MANCIQDARDGPATLDNRISSSGDGDLLLEIKQKRVRKKCRHPKEIRWARKARSMQSGILNDPCEREERAEAVAGCALYI